MKKFNILLLVFFLFFSCKKEKPTCENGRYDEGEIGLDCGGICPDCVFDKNEIMGKAWIDVEVGEIIREHFYDNDNHFQYNWTQNSPITILPSDPNIGFTWNWINDSDTLFFSYLNWSTFEFDSSTRKIIYVNEGSYKFKTEEDNWEGIHPAVLFE